MWGLEIFRDEQGAYSWRLWGPDGRKVVRAPEAFAARCNAELAAERFRDAAHELVFEPYLADAGAWGWAARTADGRLMAVSTDAFRDEAAAREDGRVVGMWAGTARFG